jgi:nucleoside-diphosphate-sugar epimerase
VHVHHNILATQCPLEACARTGVPRLVAASSSVYGDGEQTRDFTHVDDAVRDNLLAMSARSTWRRSTSGVAGR